MSQKKLYKGVSTGYVGWHYLFVQNPLDGEIQKICLPERYALDKAKMRIYASDEGKRKVVGTEWDKPYKHEARKAALAKKQLARLLSAGWQIVSPTVLGITSREEAREWKKGTDVVIGTTQAGDQSHGGKHNSGEVDHEAQTLSEKPRRGKRGGRGGDKTTKKAQRKVRPQKKQKMLKQSARQTGSGHVFSPQPVYASPEDLKSAEKSAQLLAKLIGRSTLKVEQGSTIDVEDLLVRLEVNDDPLPALEVPGEKPKMRILITPDSSGSCQDWSGLACAWAQHLASLPDIEVVYLQNSNGQSTAVKDKALVQIARRVGVQLKADGSYLTDEEFIRIGLNFDVVIYLGDGDGYENCKIWTSCGAMVVGLDSYSASVEKPRLRKVKAGSGQLFWVDRVSAKSPSTWHEALQLALK